jgi:hypothetical protein
MVKVKSKVKKNYTDKNIVAKLKNLRDTLLDRFEAIVISGKNTGSAGAFELFVRTSEQLYRMEDRLADKKATNGITGKIELVFNRTDDVEEDKNIIIDDDN